MSPFEQALVDLSDPGTWCRGARVLAGLGDDRAIVALARAMGTSVEADKGCLYDALEALDTATYARRLADSGDPSERATAIWLMELFSDDAQLEPLARIALADAEASLRAAAARTVEVQKRTAEWEATVIRLLEAHDPAVRAAAIDSLAPQATDTARAALRDRLNHEADPSLHARLRATLGA